MGNIRCCATWTSALGLKKTEAAVRYRAPLPWSVLIPLGTGGDTVRPTSYICHLWRDMACGHRLHSAIYRLCPNSPEPTLRPSLGVHVLGTQEYLCSPAPATQGQCLSQSAPAL